MSQQNKPQTASPEQVYQQFNKNELSSRQLFELLYNEYRSSQIELNQLRMQVAQLIQEKQEWQKGSKKEEPKSKIIKKGKK